MKTLQPQGASIGEPPSWSAAVLCRFRYAGAFTVFFALAVLVGVSLRAAAPFDYGTFLKAVRVPPEFTIELAAGEPLIRFPMFACFDDEGHLYIAESSGRDLYAGLKNLSRDCRVSRLEDANGDGRFEKAVVFQEQVTFPMGLAWRAGRLYLADPPELVATDRHRRGWPRGPARSRSARVRAHR